ncbi:MAG: DNA-3-methyladenine glycosylase [Cellulosilyticaceae bacterium]
MEDQEEGKILPRAFYLRDALTVAKALLGQYLVREIDGRKAYFKIVETEAYMAPEDKACHAYGNKATPRTKTMFLEGGVAYIYLIYGMYHCLNIVTEQEGIAHAVLIRGVEPIGEEAFALCKQYRKIKSKKVQDLTNGPGKLCQALSIDRNLDGHTLLEQGALYVMRGDEVPEVVATKRVNIDYAEEYREKLWRFYIPHNTFVSPVKFS